MFSRLGFNFISRSRPNNYIELSNIDDPESEPLRRQSVRVSSSPRFTVSLRTALLGVATLLGAAAFEKTSSRQPSVPIEPIVTPRSVSITFPATTPPIATDAVTEAQSVETAPTEAAIALRETFTKPLCEFSLDTQKKVKLFKTQANSPNIDPLAGLTANELLEQNGIFALDPKDLSSIIMPGSAFSHPGLFPFFRPIMLLDIIDNPFNAETTTKLAQANLIQKKSDNSGYVMTFVTPQLKVKFSPLLLTWSELTTETQRKSYVATMIPSLDKKLSDLKLDDSAKKTYLSLLLNNVNINALSLIQIPQISNAINNLGFQKIMATRHITNAPNQNQDLCNYLINYKV
jgi:hypothetical protein